LLKKWLVYIFWRPFELFCRWSPLVPIRLRIEEHSPGIQVVYLNNLVTKFLSKTSGGYSYAVLCIVDKELVFDTGYAWATKTLCRYIQAERLTESIRYIVNSHYHEDHCGTNHRLSEICTSAQVYAHRLEIPQMMYPSSFAWYRRFLFGPTDPHIVQTIPEHFVLSSGRKLQVIETPGHTPGHICLYDPQTKALFAGDLFIDVSVDSQLPEVNGSDWICSLQRVLELDIEILFDGHGVVLRGKEAREGLVQKLQFLEDLRARVQKVVAQNQPRTLNELVQEIFSADSIVNAISMNEGWMSVITSGDFSRSHVIRGFVNEALQQQQETKED